jgi:tetratricopeptide (TPR) repeat protein
MCKISYKKYRQEFYDGDASKVARPRTLSEWFEFGRQCFHQPDGVRAVAALKKVTGMHPGYRHGDGDNPYYYLGKIHEVENRLRHAIVFYTRALAVDPLDEDSLAGRGTCYTMTRQHEAAIHDFERLLRFPKTMRRLPNKHLYFMLAENCRRLERWIDAFFWEKLEHEAAAGDEQYGMLYESMVDSAHGRQVVGNA